MCLAKKKDYSSINLLLILSNHNVIMKKLQSTIVIGVLLIFVAFEGKSQVTNNFGLIHHYPIADTPAFIDVVNGFHGNTFGTLVSATDRFNNPSGAVAFDSASYVEIPYTIFPSSRISYTITGWVKPYDKVGEIINDRTLQTSYSYKYRIINYYPGPAPVEYNSYVSCFYEGGAGCVYSTCNTTPLVNQWYFFAASIDTISGYHKYYLNGVVVDSSLAPNNYSPFNNHTIIGIILGPTNENPFKGAMDDLRFYNRALSTLEMDTLYHGYSPPTTSLSSTFTNLPPVVTTYDAYSHFLNISNLPHKGFQFAIFDVLGRRLSIKSIDYDNQKTIRLLLPDVNIGIYYCHLIDKNTGKATTLKFVVSEQE